MLRPTDVDALAAQVASGSLLTPHQAAQLIATTRGLYAERTRWPRPQVRLRLKRAAKKGARATPKRWSHLRVLSPGA